MKKEARKASDRAFDPARIRRRMIESAPFKALLDRHLRTRDAAAGNLIGASAGLVSAAFYAGTPRPVICLAATSEDARILFADVRFWLPNDARILYFPSLEETLADDRDGVTAFGQRLECLKRLAKKEPIFVVTSVPAIVAETPRPGALDGASLDLRVGMDLDRDDLVKRLVGAGYGREPLVELPGRISVRGAIVDIFDPAHSAPLRVEFDGDVVESIRAFDPATQLSLDQHQRAVVSLLVRLGEPETVAAHAPTSIFDFLPADTAAIVRDPEDVKKTFDRAKEEASLIDRRIALQSLVPMYDLSPLVLSRLPVGADAGIDFAIGAIESRGQDFDAALETLAAAAADGGETAVVFVTDAERERFWESAGEHARKDVQAARADGRILDVTALTGRGFRWKDHGFALTPHRELFAIVVTRRPVNPKKDVRSRAIDDFIDLKEGDYVVHVAHGIGKFVGLEAVEKNGEPQDFLTLEFADQVRLYVPVAKSDLVQKYIGGRGEAPKLSKVGGRAWKTKKTEVFKAVADLAAELLETQAIRQREEGFSFPADTHWQHEFEAAFPYEETPDQLAAVEAIRTDMESKRPMDRLLCGDVGYGKTEVAMRAAFKAAQASKQAAILVPTTVLAEQHAVTFAERMSDFPVRVECLSRFKTRAEQEKILVGLAEGTVDIIIGTHRLLSSDIVFKDLGILIIDEEQRFGVAHKHRLRSLRRHVDVLTLSATPIPRTLHMSMLGIRDISTLTQAPAARQPVETKIVQYDTKLIRAAVLHELERGGQCFFVHNRVQTIKRIVAELQKIVPEARIALAHGQMNEHEIEENMHGFVRREKDILVATTIIESGLDIPNANTIFIDRPEMYGLADLHQLRGRVGRYREKAFAYLLLRPDSLLTDESEKRLRAIEEFTELGSGFRIAMRDLEIRGAGNILGHEQHGHISAVGYEMYCRLLEVAVKKLKNEDVVLPDEVDLNLNFEACLPKDYIPDIRAKLEMYRKFGRATNDAEFEQLLAELRDRFGDPPREATDFVVICRIRALLERMRIRSIAVSPGHGLLIRPMHLPSTRLRLERSKGRFRVIGGKDVLLVHPLPFQSPDRVLDVLTAALRPNAGAVESKRS